MPVFRRATRVAAPIEEVWDFHSRITGLEALTPDWMGLEVEEVVGPDGERDPDILVEGTRIVSSVRPFGAGPRQRWTSVITEREEGEGTATFRDEMEGGPFEHWEHTHSFFADGDVTVVRDRVEYRLPYGGVGQALGPLAKVGLAPFFRYRHRKTREHLEG